VSQKIEESNYHRENQIVEKRRNLKGGDIFLFVEVLYV